MPQEFRSKLTKAADQREDEARGLCFGWLVCSQIQISVEEKTHKSKSESES